MIHAVTSIVGIIVGSCFIAALQPSTVNAQERLRLSLERSISIGLENSKSLHASLMRVQAADAKSSETEVLKLPSLKFGATYTRLSETPPFEVSIPLPPPAPSKFVISPSIFDNYNLRLTLQQPLFTGFKLSSAASMTDFAAQAADQDHKRDQSELVFSIRNAYWGLFRAVEFQKVIDENVTQVQMHFRDVENFYNQGLVTKNEVLKVQVQLSNVQLLQIDARNNVRLAAIAFNSIVGLPLETELVLESQPRRIETRLDSADILVRKALEQRPEIRGMGLRVRAGESAVTMASAGWFPQIYLMGSYYYSRPNTRIIPALNEFRDTWDVSLSVSLDIWNWGTTIHQTNQAKAQLAEVRDILGQMQDGIALEVMQSHFTLRQSGERITVAEKGVQQAEENYRITNEKFRSGIVLNSDLLDAEAALLQARFTFIQALVDHELADAKLQKAIGD